LDSDPLQKERILKLTAAARDKIPGKSFALPGRRYPINDENHARNALARVSGNGSPAEKATVKAKVKAKFPRIGQKKNVIEQASEINP
jgi:hypothetical protein